MTTENLLRKLKWNLKEKRLNNLLILKTYLRKGEKRDRRVFKPLERKERRNSMQILITKTNNLVIILNQ